MGNYNYDALVVADQALKTGKKIRFTLDNGMVFPHEEVIRIDGGPEAFEFRLSEEGARVPDPELGFKAGDTTYADFNNIVSAELVDD